MHSNTFSLLLCLTYLWKSETLSQNINVSMIVSTFILQNALGNSLLAKWNSKSLRSASTQVVAAAGLEMGLTHPASFTKR